MRAHRVGPLTSNRGPRTLICKLLRFTDRDRVLKASRQVPLKLGDRDIHFSADYSQHTITQRQAFATAMEEVKKQGFQAFLLYPAKLKLTRGHGQHAFDTKTQAEDSTQDNNTQVKELTDHLCYRMAAYSDCA